MRLSRKSFLDWLYSHDPKDIVGYAIDSARSPLATYLREVTPLPQGHVLEVYPEGVFVYDEAALDGKSLHSIKPRKLPLWAESFEKKVDTAAVRGFGREVTRDTALTIMTQV